MTENKKLALGVKDSPQQLVPSAKLGAVNKSGSGTKSSISYHSNGLEVWFF
jgi:hypothetical protein